MLLGEEVFVRVVLQTSPWIILQGGERSRTPLPTPACGKGQGIIPKHPPSWGISCVERCAHALGMLVHVSVNPSGKKPSAPPPAPAPWPCRCGSGEPDSSVLAQPVPWERAGK